MSTEHDKPPISADARSGSIPHLVHQIWLQGGSIPEPLATWVDKVATDCDSCGWEYRLWTETDIFLNLPESAWHLWTTYSPRCCHRAQRADLLRYLILFEHGGLYLDTDIELFALPERLSGAWIAGIHGHRCVSPCAMACEPGHPYLRRIVDRFPLVAWERHMAAGAELCASALALDVHVWPRDAWHVPVQGVRLGTHHALGCSTGSYK